MSLNKKGQLDHPIVFIALFIILLIVGAPILLKIVNSISAPLSASFGNVSAGGNIAQTNFDFVSDTYVNSWDRIVLASFFIMTLFMFMTAFFVPAHPVFLIFYLVINFMLILFAPSIVASADNIYSSSLFTNEVVTLQFTNALRNYYIPILIGLMVITGIIIYGRIGAIGLGRRQRI